MTVKRLFCSKCRDELGHSIARFKASPDDFRRISVLAQLRSGIFLCRCDRCGHTWRSSSPEAAAIAARKA